MPFAALLLVLAAATPESQLPKWLTQRSPGYGWMYAVGFSGTDCGEAQGTHDAKRQAIAVLSLLLGADVEVEDTKRGLGPSPTGRSGTTHNKVLLASAPLLPDDETVVIAEEHVAGGVAVLVAARWEAASRRRTDRRVTLHHVARDAQHSTPTSMQRIRRHSVSLSEQGRPGLSFVATEGLEPFVSRACARGLDTKRGRLPVWLRMPHHFTHHARPPNPPGVTHHVYGGQGRHEGINTDVSATYLFALSHALREVHRTKPKPRLPPLFITELFIGDGVTKASVAVALPPNPWLNKARGAKSQRPRSPR